MKNSDQVYFFKRLSFLLKADITLPVALTLIRDQSHGNLRIIYTRIVTHISTGKRLSASLKSFPQIYTQHTVELLRSGEESGNLAEFASIVADDLHHRQMLKQKVIGSLMYPIVIALSTIALSLFLLFSIFPKVKMLFKSLRVTLPLSTRIIIWITDFLQRYGIWFFIVIATAALAITLLIRFNIKAKCIRDVLIRRTPIAGTFSIHYCLITFFRTFGLMLSASIPLEKALGLTRESLSQTEYTAALKIVASRIAEGNTLASALSFFPHLFPSAVTQLVEVGEASGTLPRMCIYISDMIAEDNEHALKTILGLIEPALMVCMGIIVGFIALSIITPLYGITEHIRR